MILSPSGLRFHMNSWCCGRIWPQIPHEFTWCWAHERPVFIHNSYDFKLLWAQVRPDSTLIIESCGFGPILDQLPSICFHIACGPVGPRFHKGLPSFWQKCPIFDVRYRDLVPCDPRVDMNSLGFAAIYAKIPYELIWLWPRMGQDSISCRIVLDLVMAQFQIGLIWTQMPCEFI